jgi:hypothetical protein
MITLDYSTAHTLACQVVAETGAEHYDEPTRTGYAYVADEEPRCLLGHVLARAGVDLDYLARYQHESVTVVLDHLTCAGLAEASYQARGFLTDLQAGNDAKLGWGEALARAATDAHHPAELEEMAKS